MAICILLFLGGVNVLESLIVLAICFVPLYFIFRMIITRVANGRIKSLNMVAAILAACLAPVLALIIGGAIMLATISYQMGDYENFDADSLRTRMDSIRASYFILERENAHPNAQEIMSENLYWEMEAGSPFSAFEGGQIFHTFHQWHKANPEQGGSVYLDDLIESWGYQKFDMTKANADEVSALMTKVPTNIIRDTDTAIIAIGFGQLVLDGKMDGGMKKLTELAIQRQLAPAMLVTYKLYERTERGTNLKIMLNDIQQVK
jgi:uncharacterized protein YfeS